LSLTVEITGLERIAAMTDPALFVQALDLAIERSAEAIRDDTKRLPPVSAKTTGYETHGIPVDTGRMRQSIQKRKLALLAAGVFADTNYSGFVQEGTGPGCRGGTSSGGSLRSSAGVRRSSRS